MAEILIVGAGLTGLSAAVHAHRQGHEVKLLEATDRPGGRVKTDQIDGYLLDHGFQVLLKAYPETQALLDYRSLDLKPFKPGAVVMDARGLHTIGDPSRNPGMLFPTLFSGVGSFADKFRMLTLKLRLTNTDIFRIFSQKEPTTSAILREYGFGEKMITQFFQPFMRGIFLENDLTTSRRMFDFVFKMFSSDDTCVPARGMEEIPKQLARRIPPGSIRVHARVSSIDGQEVVLENGDRIQAEKILIATEGNGLAEQFMPKPLPAPHTVTCVYFSADHTPISAPLIGLNALPNPFMNNLAVMSQVSGAYTPQGKHLLSATVLGTPELSDDALANNIREESRQWFGAAVDEWQLLKVYRIPYALPNQETVRDHMLPAEMKVREGLWLAGDHQLNGSINAAMKAGRLAVQAVLGG
ncbi:MAG: NAD(P)/FAD-dependent oxidoreductase [Bacteroidota bacterium]